MTKSAIQEIPSELRKPAETLKVGCVAIVDDAFDDISQQGLNKAEAEDLWQKIESNITLFEELNSLEEQIYNAEDLTLELAKSLLESDSTASEFREIWKSSIVGNRVESGITQVNRLKQLLSETPNLEIHAFGSDATDAELIQCGPQILFLDWFLGKDDPPISSQSTSGPGHIPPATRASLKLASRIWKEWPVCKQKPVIVLMSSKPDLERDAEAFCLNSKIMRGMFYFISKVTLLDAFQFKNYMDLFSKSISVGIRLQGFLKFLENEIDKATDSFIEGISSLTLTDYSYIQSLGLQDEGQQLGDYLLELFGFYFGSLLFSDAVRNGESFLDTDSFLEMLPSQSPPSGRLSEIYSSVNFENNSGLFNDATTAEKVSEQPSVDGLTLRLGDIFRMEKSLDKAQCHPDLLLLINPQCDLVSRPDCDGQGKGSLLMLPGNLERILNIESRQSELVTEPFYHEGGSYRVKWDIKAPLAIPRVKFETWKSDKGYRRIAQLRLPLALRLQHAFASDLTRVGTQIPLPIYQSAGAGILHPNSKGCFEIVDELEDGEDAYLVFVGDSPRCVLTLPLLDRLKKILDRYLVDLRNPKSNVAKEEGPAEYLPQKADSFDKSINDDNKWKDIRTPFELRDKPKKFIDDRVLICRDKQEGEKAVSKVVVAVSLNLEKSSS